MRSIAPLLVLLALAAAAEPDPEAIYRERFNDIVSNGRGELTTYSPLEAVKGARKAKPLPVADPDERTIRADALAAAHDYAARNNSSALLVWRDGKLELASYFGETTRDTGVVSKSLAKPLTALAIGRAIALGKIRSLDQPVADFITEWRSGPKAAIKVRHLLDMRAGLLAQGFNSDPNNIWSRAYLHPHHERILINEYPLSDAPGTRYEYSNATSELVALVIERATGRRYADFIGTEVLRPLGAAGGEVWVNRQGGLAHSGCCIMLPAETWLRLGVLVLNDGLWRGKRLLPAGYVEAMRTPTAENPWYGLGLWLAGDYVERRGFANPARKLPGVLHSEPYLAADTVMFDGNSNQIVYIIPSERLVILRTGATPPKSPEWDNSALPNMIIRGIVRRAGETPPTPQPRAAAP